MAPPPSPLPHVGAVAVARADLQSDIAALAWLDVHAPQGREHLALPSDLFLLTVYCDDSLLCGVPEDAQGLQVAVSSLRTRRAQFRSLGQGQLALALLTPQGLIRLLRAPLDGLTDRRVPLAWFCGGREQQRLRQLLLSEADAPTRLLRLAGWVEERVHRRQGLGLQQRRTARAASVLQLHAGRADLAALCRQLDVTQRQLERDFRRWLGLSPAAYARLVRFQLAAASVCSGSPFLAAALEHRYADQSHLNREFRLLSGMTPGALAAAAGSEQRARERHALARRVVMVDLPPAEA